jgi:lipopolysaccharide export system permease protein
MNSDSELAVIEAAGGARSIQTKPIVLLAIILSLIALALSHFVEPWAYKHKRDIIAKAGADLVRFAVQSGTFQQLADNLFIQIADQLPSGDFAGIFISDSRKPDTDLIYYAKRGTIRKVDGAEILVLANGEVQRKNPGTGELSIIRFELYFLDFNQFGSTGGSVNYSPKERSTNYLLYAPHSDEFFSRNQPKDVRGEIYRRFSEWLYPLVFGTIAIYFAVGARSNRQERLWSLTAGVAVAVAVRGAGFFLVNVSGINSLYAFLNFAIPIGSILLFSTLILMDKSLRFSQAWVDGAGSLATSAARWWTQRRFGGALPQSGPGGPR